MAVKIQCSACKRWYSAPDTMAGKALKCAACGNVVCVPGNAPAAGAPEVIDLVAADETRPPSQAPVQFPTAPAMGQMPGYPQQAPSFPQQGPRPGAAPGGPQFGYP